ncbi:MAG: hypothetical protein EOP55_21315 [Sphingobacteriales bacterium]|nr:MAG: hypothetical protein EOP55_21315 [Sphingobacteriales bacterium]
MRINRTNNLADGYTFVLHRPSTNQRLTTCGLPDNMKREGVVVVFSGEEKQMTPDEKWTATPFEVTSATLVGVMPGHNPGMAAK